MEMQRGAAVEDQVRRGQDKETHFKDCRSVALWLRVELVKKKDYDAFAGKLPALIQSVFGIPLEGQASQEASVQKREVVPLLIQASSYSYEPNSYASEMVRLMSNYRTEHDRFSFLDAVIRVRRNQHNARNFKFPARFLPEPLARQREIDDIVIQSQDGSEMMVPPCPPPAPPPPSAPTCGRRRQVLCDALELVVYAMAAFPVVWKKWDMRREDPPSVAFNGYVVGADRWPRKDSPDDAYIRLLHTYMGALFKAEVRSPAARGVRLGR